MTKVQNIVHKMYIEKSQFWEQFLFQKGTNESENNGELTSERQLTGLLWTLVRSQRLSICLGFPI